MQRAGMRWSFPNQTSLWFHNFQSFSLVLDIKENGWSMPLFQRLIKTNTGGWTFCTLLHLSWPCICQQEHKTTVLWQNKTRPRFSPAADKALHWLTPSPTLNCSGFSAGLWTQFYPSLPAAHKPQWKWFSLVLTWMRPLVAHQELSGLGNTTIIWRTRWMNKHKLTNSGVLTHLDLKWG